MATDIDGLKRFLRIGHDEDDRMLETLLDAAESDALEFCDRSELPDDPAVDVAIYMLARSMFDATTADDAAGWRIVARRMLWPFRLGLGV